MSLQQVKLALRQADFKPHTLAFGGDITDIPGLLSPMAETLEHQAKKALLTTIQDRASAQKISSSDMAMLAPT